MKTYCIKQETSLLVGIWWAFWLPVLTCSCKSPFLLRLQYLASLSYSLQPCVPRRLSSCVRLILNVGARFDTTQVDITEDQTSPDQLREASRSCKQQGMSWRTLLRSLLAKSLTRMYYAPTAVCDGAGFGPSTHTRWCSWLPARGDARNLERCRRTRIWLWCMARQCIRVLAPIMANWLSNCGDCRGHCHRDNQHLTTDWLVHHPTL